MLSILFAAYLAAGSPLDAARDAEDRAALERIAADNIAAAEKNPNDAEAQYHAALAASYLGEVALELKDKKLAEDAAERGIKPAERSVALKPSDARYYVVLGTLYGQVVPANVLMGLSYGKKSKDAIQKAIELDPKLASAYEARGVGNYYLPQQLGGGFELAIADFRKSIELDPQRAESYLWLGLSLRKENKNGEARQAFQKALQLDPSRVWIKQQLDKTPAQ
jgi:tetratricopeptide (TPR) repeat protein